MNSKLDLSEVKAKLPAIQGWQVNHREQIERTFEFSGFMNGIAFVNAAAGLAEQMNHHPDILINWNKVTLSINTHDAQGITNKDLEFALGANELALKIPNTTFP